VDKKFSESIRIGVFMTVVFSMIIGGFAHSFGIAIGVFGLGILGTVLGVAFAYRDAFNDPK
jgi:hypothetical protein